LEWHWFFGKLAFDICLFYAWLWRLIAWRGSLIFTIYFSVTAFVATKFSSQYSLNIVVHSGVYVLAPPRPGGDGGLYLGPLDIIEFSTFSCVHVLV
jgi:hypothetical protein